MGDAMVMVIEDEKEIRDLLQYNLERAGWKVATFDDGEKGLDQIFAARPDAVVLDLMLPGRNGLEILREVRAEPATADLPVLVLTARGAEMDKLLGFEHGADDYLTKPFSPREVVARLRALLRRSRPQGAGATLVRGALRIDFDAREARRVARRAAAQGVGIRLPRRDPHRGRARAAPPHEAGRGRDLDRDGDGLGLQVRHAARRELRCSCGRCAPGSSSPPHWC